MRKEDIVEAAMEMVGTPFHAQASLVSVGTDCIGVVKHVARRVGFKFKDRAAYSMNPTGELQPILEEYLVRVEGEPEVGNVLLMKWKGYDPHHVAVYVGNGQIVHAYNKARKVVKQDYSKEWQEKTVAIYRFPGVE